MNKTIIEYRNQPGVKDLSTAVGGRFALALKYEDEGNAKGAEEQLEKAIALEAEGTKEIPQAAHSL